MDVAAGVGLLASLGVEHSLEGGTLIARGARQGGRLSWVSPSVVQVGESGTLARMATALLALCGDPRQTVEVRGGGSLARRRSPALLRALERAGARVEVARSGGWPVTLRASVGAADLSLDHPSSSQEASALLLALAGREGVGTLAVRGVLPSRPYLDMTCGVLAEMGVEVRSEREGDIERFTLRGPLRPPPGGFAIEADASAGAVALAAGCLSGGSVRVDGVGAGSLQGDVAIVAHLRAFGCGAGAEADHLWAEGRPVRGAVCDLAGQPDLAPVLAVVAAGAAAAGFSSRLEGLQTLDGKESPRLRVLEASLRSLGFQARVSGVSLELEPGGPRVAETLLDPVGDHRMAFAQALLGLVSPGVRVTDPACVGKSWPGFWEELPRLQHPGA